MLRIGLVCALMLWAGGALAAEKLQFGPPAAWVKTEVLAQTPVEPNDVAPARRLLTDLQVNFGPDGNEIYVDTAIRIQNVQGLAVGGVGIQWQPDTETITVHSVRVLRGGQVLDVLARGQTFTVLRRETNLERAMLDGVLTATLQPEGLQVGDVVEFSYTKRQRDPTLQNHSELVAGLQPGPAIDRARIRALWPNAKPIRWRQTSGLPPAVLTKTATGTELLIEADKVERPKLPKGAPARFGYVSTAEFSDFTDWAQVSSIMSPLYRKAATLAPNSPIRAEAAKIRAASSDPNVQAMTALRLVQDQIRYLFLGMNLGGYVPADADATWQRRFGDCKAKTALLLALLNELGIEAKPALVSTVAGDGMDERLPTVELFNHILIKAQLGGKTYWLDGTRTGDRTLEGLQVPPWRWALPVQVSGAALEKLTIPPLDLPNIETNVIIDATAGLTSPAPARVELTLRGDAANALHQMIATVPPADLKKTLQSGLAGTLRGLEPGLVEAQFDDLTGQQQVTLAGSVFMGWTPQAATGLLQYAPDAGRLTANSDFKRDPGYGYDAPFAVPHPNYAKVVQTILLPQAGKGFSLVGGTIDQTIAGTQYKRTARLEKGSLIIESSARTVAEDFPASAAPSAREQLSDIIGVPLLIQAPKGFQAGEAELAIRLARTPTTAGAYMDRGEAWFEKDEVDKALADYEMALKLRPNEPASLNGRCFARARAGKMLEAGLADCDAAIDLEPRSAGILDSRGLVNFRLGRLARAIADYDRALRIEPNLAPSLYVRGLAKRASGDRAGGDQDISAAKRIDNKVAKTYARYGVK